MFKHNANSIKESQLKSFVSSTEKAKWNSKAEANHKHNDLYHTKTEVNNALDTMYKSVEGQTISTSSKSGFTRDLEIHGNSKQRVETIKIVPTFDYGSIDNNGQEIGSAAPDSNGNVNIRTGFIDAQYNDVLVYTSNGNNRAFHVHFYDEDKNHLGVFYIVNADNKIIDDPRTKYIRIRHWQYNNENLLLTITRTHLDDIESVGMKVGENTYQFDVITRGVNMAKPCMLLTKNRQYPDMKQEPRYAAKELIEVKPNTKYRFSTKNNTETKYCIWLDEDEKFISRSDQGLPSTYMNVTSPGNAKYVQLYVWNELTQLDRNNEMVDNMWTFVEVSSFSDPVKVEEYAEHKQTIEIPVQLKGISTGTSIHEEYRDVLKVVNGRLVVEQRVGELQFVCNDEMAWSTRPNSIEGISTYECYFKNVKYNKISPNSVLPILSTIYQSKPYGTIFHQINELGIGGKHYDGVLIVRCNISDDLVGGQDDVPKLGKLFEGTTLYYPLDDKNVIDLGPAESFNLKLINGETHILSVNTPVKPIIKCKVPTSIGAVLYSNSSALNELKKELESVNTLTSDGNTDVYVDNRICSIPNTNDGTYLTDVVIEGKTIKNIANLYEWNNLLETPNGWEASLSNGWFKIAYNHTNDLLNGRSIDQGDAPIKAGKVYTIFVTIKSNTRTIDTEILPMAWDYATEKVGGPHVKAKETGVKVFKFKAVKDYNLKVGFKSVNTTMDGGYIEFGNVMLLEGDYSHTNIGYFEGLKSVSSDLSIKTTNQNLLTDGDKNIVLSEAWKKVYPLNVKINDEGKMVLRSTKVNSEYWIQYITLKPNTWYESSVDIKDISPGLYDEANYWRYKHCVYRSATTNRGKFKTGKSTKYCAILYGGEVDVELVRPEFLYITEIKDENTANSVDFQHVGYTETDYASKALSLSDTLKSTPNGTKDTIEYVNGELCVVRRCGSILINGNSNEVWSIDDDQSTGVNTKLYRMNFADRNYKENTLAISDKLPTNGVYFVDDREGITINNAHLRVRLRNGRLGSEPTIDKFKEWLQNNPINAVYELGTPIIEPLNTNLSIPTFGSRTTVTIDSGIVPATLKGKITTRLADTIHVVTDKIVTLEKQEVLINRIKLRSSYEAHKTNFSMDIRRSVNRLDIDLFKLYCINILEGPHNYKREVIEEHIDFYTIIGVFNYDMADYLFSIISEQHPEEI